MRTMGWEAVRRARVGPRDDLQELRLEWKESRGRGLGDICLRYFSSVLVAFLQAYFFLELQSFRFGLAKSAWGRERCSDTLVLQTFSIGVEF